jgi:hypothetical protein
MAYEQRLYLTCLDLGAWGALITCGFERNRILVAGADAKPVKRFINTRVIYPPLTGDPRALLAAAQPPAGGRLRAALFTWAAGNRYLRARLIATARKSLAVPPLAPQATSGRSRSSGAA